MYVGVTAFRFRRERGLFEHERIARIRWDDSGEQAIQWIGARTAVPIVGIDSGDPDQAALSDPGVDRDPATGDRGDDNQDLNVTAEAYLEETDFPGFDFDPASDRLRLGEDWAFHPLSETGLVHYRYALGDTLRVDLPANDLAVVLYEVRVAPRRADFELLAGSLWVDSASASLVRATYRPARPWSLRLDEPEAAADVPAFVGPVEAEIHYITIESTLQDFEYWLPRRFAFQGEGRAGGLFRIPVTLEWSVGDYVVNEPPAEVLVTGNLPEGWQREVQVETDDDGGETAYTVIVPTTEELRRSSMLSEDFGRRTPVTFSAAEIAELTSELEELVPTYRPFPPPIAWGLAQGQLRFNRVEGLSAGAATAIALDSRVYLDLAGRLGTGDRIPNSALALRWGPETDEWRLEGYHRLVSMNDRDNPFSLVNSLKNVAAGGDRGEYYRASGSSLGFQRRGTHITTDFRAFYERQRSVEQTTDFSLRGVLGGYDARTVLEAEDLDLGGARASVGWFVGTDPSSWILTGEVAGEVAFGDAAYRRARARLSVSHPLLLQLTGGLEIAAGTSWDRLPVQRSFFLGGPQTLRGFYINELLGSAFWRARGELAAGFVGARVSLFSDVGWVGERSDFRLDDPLVAVGVGTSLLDGLVRLDLARALRGSERLSVHLYLDGLL
jgi:hypothetical protein